MARRPRQPTPDERALWAKVAATIDPLRRPDMPVAAHPPPDQPAPHPAPPVIGAQPVKAARTAKAAGPAEPAKPVDSAKPAKAPKAKKAARRGEPHVATVYTPPPALKPSRPGGLAAFGQMDRRSHDKLRRGRFVIDSRLDLHGMTQAQAHGALRRFILDNHRRGRRKLLVITGKGGGGLSDPLDRPKGVLRGKLKQWLLEPDLRPLVLGLEPARPDHGGAGAFYLLLRRVREG